MNWILWILAIIFIPIIINPILLFIRFELYQKKDWINFVNCRRSDERFFKTESSWKPDIDGIQRQYLKTIKIAEPRPTIGDFWEFVLSEYHEFAWYCPVISAMFLTYNVLYIILRPLGSVLEWLFNKIKNIKI